MPYAQTNGIRLHYEVEGHGSPLLFIAGLGQPAIAWDPELIRTLARSYQIIPMTIAAQDSPISQTNCIPSPYSRATPSGYSIRSQFLARICLVSRWEA